MFSFDDPAFLGSLNIYDADAFAYIKAVEIADGQELEPSVRTAINDFVIGCKADATWNAIKASCIMAGARTLTGALVPLKGTAPTNFNFVSGDYSRTTGLKGNGSTKYLNSNRNNNADPQNSKHLAVYQSSIATSDTIIIGTANTTGRSALVSLQVGGISARINSITLASTVGNGIGFVGGVRSQSTTSIARVNGTSFSQSITSETPVNQDIGVFGSVTGAALTDARLAFYSIGESLDLSLLDARVTTLINAIQAALP